MYVYSLLFRIWMCQHRHRGSRDAARCRFLARTKSTWSRPTRFHPMGKHFPWTGRQLCSIFPGRSVHLVTSLRYTKVVYMSSSFWLLALGSCDLSQVEKEITSFQAEQINKTTTIFTQNGRFDWKKLSLWIYSACKQLFLSQLEISHVTQEPTAQNELTSRPP